MGLKNILGKRPKKQVNIRIQSHFMDGQEFPGVDKSRQGFSPGQINAIFRVFGPNARILSKSEDSSGSRIE